VIFVVVGVLLLLLFLSAVFSGSETGVYSISRMRLSAEAREGRRAARIVRRLLGSDAGFLITLLVGNNLMLELLTHGFESELLPAGLSGGARAAVATLVLTPAVFLFGELLPKDVFRRRPHRFLLMAGPLLAVVRTLLLPISWPLHLLSRTLERTFGLGRREVSRAFRREEMIEILQESTRTGVLSPRAEALAQNVLVLRETPVEKVMIPWDRVRRIDVDLSDEAARRELAGSEFTRLPATSRAEEGGPRVVGYLHLLDVLGGGGTVAEEVRRLPRLDPGVPVDRALAKLRISGHRLALVGSSEAPLGLVTLMDLLAAIARESGPAQR
jgi:CBS domain containing-hemolysin-like protein